jgi:hypothetical protein
MYHIHKIKSLDACRGLGRNWMKNTGTDFLSFHPVSLLEVYTLKLNISYGCG